MARRRGQTATAQAYADSVRRAFEPWLRRDPADGLVRAGLAMTYAWLGQRAEAAREAGDALRTILSYGNAEVEMDAREWIAAAYAQIGEHDAAIDQLEYLLSHPSKLQRLVEGKP